MISGEGHQGGALPRRRWLTGTTGHDDGREVPAGYARAWRSLIIAVAADPAWTTWWARSGVRSLELMAVHGRGSGRRSRVLRGRATVRVDCTLDGGNLDAAVLAGGSGAGQDAAAHDLLRLLELARGDLGLPPLPPLPPLLAPLPQAQASPQPQPQPQPQAQAQASLAVDVPGGRRPVDRAAAGYAALPDGTDEVVRTMVEVMGIPLEQAMAIVHGGSGA